MWYHAYIIKPDNAHNDENIGVSLGYNDMLSDMNKLGYEEPTP